MTLHVCETAIPVAAQYNWPSTVTNGDALGPGGSRLPFPPLTIRAGSHLDQHLMSQNFSYCTVPLVSALHSQWGRSARIQLHNKLY